MNGDLAAAVARLREEPGKNMALVGGVGTAQEFMKLGLIDDYFFAVFPVILGRGPELFGDLAEQVTLKLVEEKRFKYGEIFLHYQALRQ